MLYYRTIDSSALELLNKLLAVPEFDSLCLAGGTSLALQIGHRRSLDLDLFGQLSSDEYTLSQRLQEIGSVTSIRNSENIKIYLVNGIKVDIVNYPYIWLEDYISQDNLRLAGKQDIAAMILAAITGRGSRKDFIDIWYLLKEYTLEDLLGFFSKKYPDGSLFLVLKSLSYFTDADNDPEPFLFDPVYWPDVKHNLTLVLEEYFKKL